MSLLAPANALTRVLEWQDFGTPRRMSAPGPGEIKMAAQTAVGWVQNPTQLDVGPVKGSNPTVYQLVTAPPSTDRHSVVQGTSGSGRVDQGGRLSFTKNTRY